MSDAIPDVNIIMQNLIQGVPTILRKTKRPYLFIEQRVSNNSFCIRSTGHGLFNNNVQLCPNTRCPSFTFCFRQNTDYQNNYQCFASQNIDFDNGLEVTGR